MVAVSNVLRQIPSHWDLLAYDTGSIDPRNVTVLCVKNTLNGGEWVTWGVNTIEGGCHLGHYFHDEQKAQWDYTQRRTRGARS